VHDDHRQVTERLDRALRRLIRPAIYATSTPLSLEMWQAPGEPVPFAEAAAAGHVPAKVGDPWGPPWSTTWFLARGTVPHSWAGRRVEAVLDLGHPSAGPGFQAEALAYDLDGVPIKGIHPRSQHVPIAAPAAGGEVVALRLEAAANPDVLADDFIPTLVGDRSTAGSDPLYRIARADLAVLDESVWHLHLDTLVASELMATLAWRDPRKHELLRALERMLDVLDPRDVAASAAGARAVLAPALARPANASAHVLSAVGHAHIDTAWLWPIRETIRKCIRTFANVTALGNEYPELVFACSQAQQYAWVKDHQPAVYERFVAAVKDGQVVPVGAMWVEPDGNLPGGEAMARQLVHGKRFFLDELGVECREIWMPDSFGYNAAMPQLARLAGIDWFLTQKLSWNQVNKLPHHTFWWEGIDGSRVFTHFPPVDTYNAGLEGAELAHAVANFAEKGRSTRSLLPFGYGDGGGGPTREMLERARRLADLEGSPRVVIESPAEFFAAAQAEYPDAPVWSGELYLELHRATFTSQAKLKWGNRRCEHLLREAELWAATAAVRHGAAYPYDELDRLWKVVLLHQFHDILPGSSIAWVHREAADAHDAAMADLNQLIATATTTLAGSGTTPWIFNAGPQHRHEVIGGTPAGVASVPALGAATMTMTAAATVTPAVAVTSRSLDNGLVRVELDDDGLIASLRDLTAGREVFAPGSRGNLLQLHTDQPNHWDAWDLDAHYRNRRVDLTRVEAITQVGDDPMVGAVRVERRFGDSRVTQTIQVRAGSPRVEVTTEIDWHQEEEILKVAFPIDVHADRSTAEIQFGHVHRPTHTNTSWDAARFETYAHRWLHVGEPGYGVAVINDATYGHDVTRTSRDGGGTTTTVRLSLVRGPRSPDPNADAGLHRMTYAIVAGASIGDAVAEGYALNLPLRAVAGSPPGGDAGTGGGLAPLVTVDNPAVVVEAVKLADDRSGDVIVRLYESRGGRASATLQAGFETDSVQVVDLLERPLDLAGRTLAPVTGDGGGGGDVRLQLRPFQIVTLRLGRAG
jgi:alpha-mannosidase